MKMAFLILLLLFTASALGTTHSFEDFDSLPHTSRKVMMRELINLDYCEGGPNQSHQPGKGRHC